MKRNTIIFIIFCAAYTPHAFAQKATDALLLSQYYSGSTARSAGMGGAFGALGGDPSVLSTNPAGLAVYRGSEFTLTPGVNFTSTDAQFDNASFNEKYSRFIFNNIGYIYTWNFYNSKGIKSMNFGIAYNRLSDFNGKAYIWNQQAGSSMLDGFAWYANYGNNGNPLQPSQLDDFYEGLAYDTYGIDDDPDYPGYYWNPYIAKGDKYDQPMKRTMTTKGGIGEYALSFGANLNHSLYFGATLGIQDVYYEESYFHEESPDFVDNLQYFNFSQDYTLSGVGLNFKAGMIYRPVQMLRLGVAIHTPTRFWLKPLLITEMETQFGIPPSGETEKTFFSDAESDHTEKFNIVTPWRYQLSAATILGNLAVVNIDMEYLNYSTCKVLPNHDYKDATDYAAEAFKNNVNVKGGAEFRLGLIYLRGGIAYYGSPYKKAYLSEFNKSYQGVMNYSGGIGFRARSFYMDAAYTFMKFPQRDPILYQTFDDLGPIDIVSPMKTSSGKAILTFGFKF
jgi:hypothetical protein